MAAKKLTGLPLQPCNEAYFDLGVIEARRQELSLRGYQESFLGFFLSQSRALDLSEAGTGKTPVACLWSYAQSREGRVVWAMPKSLLTKNYMELLLWSNLEPHQITLVDGTKAQREQQFANRDTRVFLMGFDAFANNWQELRALYPDLRHLAVDELHLGFSTHGYRDFRRHDKVHGTKRTVLMYEYLRAGGNFLGMTGTLIDGRLTAAYPSIHVIEPRYYPTYDNFMQWHALVDEYGKPFYWKNHDRLKEILSRHSRRITFEEAYGKEQKEFFVEWCTFGKDQLKAYKDIEHKGITELESGNLTAAVPAVGVRRCLELMQCPEKYGIKQCPRDGKDAHLADYLATAKESGKPLIVFEPIVAAHARLAKLCEKAGVPYTIINGQVTGKARDKADRDFREGRALVLICSPEVAGVGFNWGHVDTILFLCLDWQDSTFIQNYRRAMRGVREKALRIVVFMYRNSWDLKIAKKLKSKAEDRLRVENGVDVDLVEAALQAA